MTDKELKKLSRLELLELLLNESRENERLRIELDKLKNENSVQKSAQHLNEASDKMNESLQNAAVLADTLNRLIAGKIVVSEIINETATDGNEAIPEEKETKETSDETKTAQAADTEETVTREKDTDEPVHTEVPLITEDDSTKEEALQPAEDENKSKNRTSVDVHIYTRLMSYFHKNSYALAFIPEDIKIDIEKRLKEITDRKIN